MYRSSTFHRPPKLHIPDGYCADTLIDDKTPLDEPFRAPLKFQFVLVEEGASWTLLSHRNVQPNSLRFPTVQVKRTATGFTLTFIDKVGAPKDTLLYLPGWSGPYDGWYPDYWPVKVVAIAQSGIWHKYQVCVLLDRTSVACKQAILIVFSNLHAFSRSKTEQGACSNLVCESLPRKKRPTADRTLSLA